MTTEQGRVPAPSIETTTSYRPAWVTDELVAQWCEWVRRDVTRHEEPAPEPATAVAPHDLSPTATVPTCAPEDVVSSFVAARADATGPRASASTPRARRSPSNGSCRSARHRSRPRRASSTEPTGSWP